MDKDITDTGCLGKREMKLHGTRWYDKLLGTVKNGTEWGGQNKLRRREDARGYEGKA